jgi:hypothetical protein
MPDAVDPWRAASPAWRQVPHCPEPPPAMRGGNASTQLNQVAKVLQGLLADARADCPIHPQWCTRVKRHALSLQSLQNLQRQMPLSRHQTPIPDRSRSPAAPAPPAAPASSQKRGQLRRRHKITARHAFAHFHNIGHGAKFGAAMGIVPRPGAYRARCMKRSNPANRQHRSWPRKAAFATRSLNSVVLS